MAKAKKPAKAAKKTSAKAKPKATKKPVAKKAVKKVAKKPAAKKAVKPVAKKAAPKPTPKKAAPKKPAAKKAIAKKTEPKKEVKVAPVKAAPAPVKKEAAAKKAPAPSRPAVKPAPVAPSLNTFFPPITQRPIAHKPVNKPAMPEDKTRYSEEELKEFESLILEKLEKARSEYRILKETLNRNNDEGTDATSGGNTKVLEDGAETAEKENLSQLAARQQKYITNLENALVRIKNGTYGICSVTGKLIPKERLYAVPHTTQSIEAKMMKND
jgi:RNA polymerase-binding transcription factor DksA